MATHSMIQQPTDSFAVSLLAGIMLVIEVAIFVMVILPAFLISLPIVFLVRYLTKNVNNR